MNAPMTNREALTILHALKRELEDIHSTLHGTLNADRLEAVSIAIRALERQTEGNKPTKPRP
jgi:hypothetical protein